MSFFRLSKKAKSFPPQIRYIVGNEACERFSFYGMRSILVVYMVDALAMEKSDASAAFHMFVSAAFFLPLLGAYLSDRYLGKYRTIIYLSLVYCLGHGVMAFSETKTGLFWGLALIALGAGGIKPCVSALVGDQFTKGNKNLVQKVFDIFYWSINFGSFFSTLLIPYFNRKYGSQVAFGIPGILMFIATVIFWMGRNSYVIVPPSGPQKGGFFKIFWTALCHLHKKKSGRTFLSAAEVKYPKPLVENAEAAWRVFKIFILVSMFWALYDQNSSTWVLQGRRMDQNFLGLHIDPAQMASLSPIFVLLLIPVFSLGIYPLLAKMRFNMTPLNRIAGGMFLTSLSFAVITLYESLLKQGVILNISWQALPYLLITGGEIMVSITGLEFAYTQAPRTMKSTMMSFWFLTIFLGNLLTAYIAKINVFSDVMFFGFFTLVMFVFAVGFLFVSRRYKVVEYLEV